MVPPLRAELEQGVGRPLAVSTVYAMLHRDGWRNGLISTRSDHRSDLDNKLTEGITASEAFERPASLRLMFQDEARLAASRTHDTVGVRSRFAHSRTPW